MADLPESVRQVLSAFDQNGDGQITRAEIYRGAELLKQEKKTTRRLTIGFVAALFTLLVSVCANFATTILAVELSKEVTLNNGRLVNKNSPAFPVATATSQSKYNMLHPNHTQSPRGPSPIHTYAHLTHLVLNFQGARLGLDVTGFLWINSSFLVFYTGVNKTVVLLNGVAQLKSGVIIPNFNSTANITSDDDRRRLQFGEVPLAVWGASELAGEMFGGAVTEGTADYFTGMAADAGLDDETASQVGNWASDQVGDAAGDYVSNGLQQMYSYHGYTYQQSSSSGYYYGR